MRVGMLTGGGDCPGLNAVIRAATRRLVDGGAEPVGVLRGWRGMIEGLYRPLDLEAVSGILPRGGTILRTSRTNPFSVEGGVEAVRTAFEQLDALIAIGGEDTLGVAARLHLEHGLPVVGVPKTIDNDIAATDQTFGFDTAVSIATEAIDRLHTTAESHDRVMVVEVMGRHAGWLAVASGIAGGADVVLIPEFPLTVERCAELIRQRHGRGKDFSIVVVSEGWPLTHEAGAGALDADGRARRVRARAPRRRRPATRGCARADHRVRDARDHARPPAAGRHPHRLRPRARDPLRPAGGRPGARRALRPDGGAPRHRRRRRAARRSRGQAAHRAARSTTRSPRRSSDEPDLIAAGHGANASGVYGAFARCAPSTTTKTHKYRGRDGRGNHREGGSKAAAGGAPLACAASLVAGRCGSRSRTVVPAPSALSTSTVPPCASAIAATIASPRPAPPWSRERDGSPR